MRKVLFTRHAQRELPSEIVPSRFGFSRPDISFGGILFLVVLLGIHIYSVNSNAVQGYRIQSLEKEIARMQEDNARLKIEEADKKSFQRIETARESLTLEQVDSPQYFEERDSVALR